MSDFKSIQGFRLKARASDPSNPFVGEIWYNTTTDIFKVRATVAGTNSFSSGGNLSTASQGATGSPAGTQNAALHVGGYLTGASPVFQVRTEEYNGTTWSSGGNTSANRSGRGGAGTQNAGLVCGGGNPYINTVEEYDGNSWTTVNGLPVSKAYMGSSGTQNAAIVSMGYNDPDQTDTQPYSHEYDGSNWTSGGNCVTPGHGHQGFGNQNAAAINGGNSGPAKVRRTEEYDGSTWTTVTQHPTETDSHAGGGVQNDAVLAGGSTNVANAITASFEYNGTNWTAGGNLSTARGSSGESGTTALDGMFSGGYPTAPGELVSTEEYGVGSPTVATKSVDTSVI